MITIKEVLKYRIHQLSQQIFQLKESAKETGGCNEFPLPKFDPKHPDWSKYVDLKRQASLSLTALKIFKHFGKVPTKADFRKTLRENAKDIKVEDLFREHAPADRGQAHAFLFEAYQALVDVEHDLKTNPTRFAEAEAYAEQRRQEVANASACR